MAKTLDDKIQRLLLGHNAQLAQRPKRSRMQAKLQRVATALESLLNEGSTKTPGVWMRLVQAADEAVAQRMAELASQNKAFGGRDAVFAVYAAARKAVEDADEKPGGAPGGMVSDERATSADKRKLANTILKELGLPVPYRGRDGDWVHLESARAVQGGLMRRGIKESEDAIAAGLDHDRRNPDVFLPGSDVPRGAAKRSR